MTEDRPGPDVLVRLFEVIAGRRGASPESSYTARLFAEGRGKIARKTGEEAIETIVAALGNDTSAVAAESADLLYHLLVLWAETGIEPSEVWVELARREGTSGLVEKAARTKT